MSEDPMAAIIGGLIALEHEALTLIDELDALGFDPRWLAIARTDLERGFMAADRALVGRRPKQIAVLSDLPGPALNGSGPSLVQAGRDCVEVI